MPRASWYSQLPPFGWFDREDRPGSAAYQVGGRPIPDSQQGIALPTRGGLGKWYNVTPPGGNLPFPMQQTDIGPAPYTGRGVDISAAGAHQMGYTPKNFPTDTNFKVEPIDLTGLGLAAKWNGGVPGDNQTAVAEGPPPPSRGQATQGRKMPNSLLDMFQPRDPAGEPAGFGDAVTSRSNSLIGLGLGLLAPSNPLRGQSSWGQGLEGFQAGAQLDARTATAAAGRRQHAADRAQSMAQHAMDRRQAQSNFERQFTRSDPANAVSPAQTAMRDVLGPDATPEQKSAFMQDFYRSKTEGNLVAQAEQRRTIARAQGLDENNPKIQAWIAGGGALNEKPRDMSVTDISKLSEEGGKFAQVGSFTQTFEPRFAGYKSSMIGDAANLAGRNLSPEIVGKDVAEGASWWQGYDRYKNVVRNDLYGSALTPSEQAAFERADITPGMDPKQIQQNLKIQKDIVQAGIQRKANAMITAGYDPQTISQAYGVNLKDIGVTATGRGGGTIAPAAPSAAPSAAPAPTAGRGGSAPPRPANVPAGSAYSPSRNQWKLPDGTVVDSAGRPI